MNSKKTQKKFDELSDQMALENRQADFNRIRSLSIGTAFGGITEINVRVNNGTSYWGLFQPVEIIEIVHQLAANIGCHIHIQPRKDFAAWRDWKYTEEELRHFGDYAPYPKELEGSRTKSTVLPPPEQQPGLNIERNQNEPVATKKTVNRRSIKRAAATT